ncbi:hypothetical protein QQF64_007871 [Cirrhinus molitorella]|uniref:DDE Tnp4 domain-containing protein n=1 Tax=Cirrhinus molitorella TaxID=172907 RepID=A0ABR3M4J1_9TELE
MEGPALSFPILTKLQGLDLLCESAPRRTKMDRKIRRGVLLEDEQPPVQQQPEEVPDHLDQHLPLELPTREVEQELLTLRTMLAQKDAEIEELKKNLTLTRLTPELLHRSNIANYFQYCTGFSYDQFNNLCSVFAVPKIVQKSYFLELMKTLMAHSYLKKGDGVMVDKGFLIEKDLEEIGLRVNIPPFAQSNKQMSATDVHKTKKIAAHRVHVERAIAKVKKFKIVSGIIPNIRAPPFVCWGWGHRAHLIRCAPGRQMQGNARALKMGLQKTGEEKPTRKKTTPFPSGLKQARKGIEEMLRENFFTLKSPMDQFGVMRRGLSSWNMGDLRKGILCQEKRQKNPCSRHEGVDTPRGNAAGTRYDLTCVVGGSATEPNGVRKPKREARLCRCTGLAVEKQHKPRTHKARAQQLPYLQRPQGGLGHPPSIHSNAYNPRTGPFCHPCFSYLGQSLQSCCSKTPDSRVPAPEKAKQFRINETLMHLRGSRGKGRREKKGNMMSGARENLGRR